MSDRPRGPGRPQHEPTDETRGTVTAMVARGEAPAAIAAAIGISEPTLLRHYEDEMATPGPQAALPLGGEETPRQPRESEARGGRPEHIPTKRNRERVEVLVAAGQTQWQIAAVLRVSVPTLVKHYAAELDDGRARKDAAVLEALYAGAKKGNVGAIRTWLGRLRPAEGPHDQPSAAPRAEPTGMALGKKEQQAELARQAARGKYEPPPPPRLAELH